jgi:two-component system cell cycle response regulator CpdR
MRANLLVVPSWGNRRATLENLKPLGHKKAGGTQGNGRGMIRILLAEDDSVMREYLTRALERSGYAVTAVDRGTAALPLIQTEHFDLLLSDIVMPEMDGIELAQKASEIAPDMRVMFITGFAAVTLRAGKQMPQARVLSKPFHLRDLVLEVDRLFEVESANGGL